MCLIAWNWQPESATPPLLIGNRDEFYARPTLPLHWWEGDHILAGKDLQAGGTWLGIDRCGRVAALTNVRDPAGTRTATPSRGELVAGFLGGTLSAAQYLEQLASRAHEYNPFNLLLCDGTSLLAFESRNRRPVALSPGLGAVSNAGFDTPWPKLRKLKAGLGALVAQPGQPDDAQLVGLLQDSARAPDAELPATGVPLEMERELSAAFIATPHYGTRACSVVRLGRHHASVIEHSHTALGPAGSVQQAFERAIPSSGLPPRQK